MKSRKAASKAQPEQLVLGWREWIELPDLGIDRIKAKVDTGARTSSLHAFDVQTRELDGEEIVEFQVHPEQRRRLPEITCVARVHDRRLVASSNGQSTERIVIKTKLSIGSREWPIEITLADRDEMGFRMLLGREALRGRAVVDPGLSFKVKR